MSIDKTNSALIVSITPYFLEKGNLWFEENLSQILEARNTQSFFEDNIIYLKSGRDYNLSEFLRKLDEMGYEKVLEVTEPGEFSQRGGTLSIFPVNMERAVRFDFLGNAIESIELLDIKTPDIEKAKE